jgi:hypothetical protein
MRDCGITDDRLFAFVDGVEETLDEHVAACDECQGFLAELWIGEAPRDLAEPVLRQIRFDEFLIAAARLGMDVVAAFGKAIIELGPGSDE